MKRSELKRKTPLKRTGPIRRKTPLKRLTMLSYFSKDARRRARRAKVQAERFGPQAELCRKSNCCACRALPPNDPHHTPTVVSGGLDRDTVPLCRECHTALHKVGEATFARIFELDLEAVKAEMRWRVLAA